jgi:hypothetical protein
MKLRPVLRHLLAVMAKVADFGCWLPSVNLNQVFTEFGGHPSGFSTNWLESRIACLPAYAQESALAYSIRLGDYVG